MQHGRKRQYNTGFERGNKMYCGYMNKEKENTRAGDQYDFE